MNIDMNPNAVKSKLTLKAIKSLLGKKEDKKQENDKDTKKVDVVGIAQKLFSNKKAQEAEEAGSKTA